MKLHRAALAVSVGLTLAACNGPLLTTGRSRPTPPPPAMPEDRAEEPAPVAERAAAPGPMGAIPASARRGEEICVAGRYYPVGVPVVLWSDPGGYDAYSTEYHFGPPPEGSGPSGLRYEPGRSLRTGEPNDQTLSELAQRVDQLVLHYDVCGVSRTCFKVLHDRRGLSVHFMLDVDGTLYQTVDLRETCWHARQANARSIGIEMAHIGAYPPGPSPLDEWYVRDAGGARLALPAWLEGGGVRTAGFVGRPARSERVRGVIQGETLEMHDFTPEQYESLERLGAELVRLFPKIRPEAPRAEDGSVLPHVMHPREYARFQGVLGHYHITDQKTDPGPAFDWERVLGGMKRNLVSP